MTSGPAIEQLADGIVARDVVSGRPGKPSTAALSAMPPLSGTRYVAPPAVASRAAVVGAVLAVVVAAVAALIVGLVSGDSTTTASTVPTATVVVTPQSPDSTTVPANPSYNALVRTTTSFVCPGQAASVVTNTAQLTIASGRFVLDPTNLPTFTGTITGNVATATASDGSLTGILAGGTAETFSWVATASPYSPCPGTFPITAVLPQPLNLQPTVVQGPALAGSIDPTTAVAGPTQQRASSGVNWGLVAGGEAAALTGLLVILVLSPGIQDEEERTAPGTPATRR